MLLYIYNYIYNIYIYIFIYIFIYIYVLYVCKLLMSQQNDANWNIKICILQSFPEWSAFWFFCRLSSMLNLLNFKMFFNGDWLFVNFGCHKEMSMKIHIHNKMTLFSKWSIFCSFSKPSTFQSEIPFYCDYWER